MGMRAQGLPLEALDDDLLDIHLDDCPICVAIYMAVFSSLVYRRMTIIMAYE